MFTQDQIKNMIFLDVETVSSHSNLDSLQKDNPALYEFWPDKANLIRKGKPEIAHLTDEEVFQTESALYTEFSKIVTISISQVVFDEAGEPQIKTKSFKNQIKSHSNCTTSNKKRIKSNKKQDKINHKSHKIKQKLNKIT